MAVFRLRELVSIDAQDGVARLRVRMRQYFQWTLTLHPEKGIAAGNVKLDLPVRSSLLLALGYFAAAYYVDVVSRFIVPAVCVAFGAFHLFAWLRALLPQRAAEPEAIPERVLEPVASVAERRPLRERARRASERHEGWSGLAP